MSLFTEWNSILLKEYFSPSKAGQNIWIPTTRLELEGIGVHIGGASGLIEAVKQGPAWIHTNDNIANKAHELARQRLWPRKRPDGYSDPGNDFETYKDKSAPTYLPYIALWVLAHSELGGKGFYASVSKLISQPFPSNVRSHMEAAWIDLAHWSNRQQNGKFGCFNLNVLGQHRFVGMAYAQAMITNKDMDGLSRLFGSCRLHSGQVLDNSHFTQLLEHGQNSNYLSSGLKAAMGKEDYKDHLKELLNACLEFWDGRVSKRINDSSAPSDQVVLQQEDNDELSIILKMNSSEEVPCWEIGWRLPATVTGLSYAIKVVGNEEVKAKLELAGTHIHCVSSFHQNNARSALNQSAAKKVESILSYTENDGERNERKIYLRQDKIRVLVWDSPDPSLHDSLLEREIPISGPVYLLYSNIEYSNLELLLINEEIVHEVLDIDGLPDQWRLLCIEDTENLTPKQRADILDDELSAATKARIRLVGGKPIVGSGSKKYAYYDLPIVELEAPAGAELISSGLTFEELGDNENVSVKRFKLTLDDGSGCIFKIKVKLGEEYLCTTGLQILAAGGLATAQWSDFSIDKYGSSLANDSGLSGATVGEALTSDLDINYFHVDDLTLTSCPETSVWECMESNIFALFMDSVATTAKGSMSYGVAREQIRRLANNGSIDDIEPALLIRELRRRGHLEIETDVKGHMVRVYSVPPTLYSLPIKNKEQRQLYGVCGSLRLQQWKELSQTIGCRVLVDKAASSKLSVVRISSDAPSGITSIAKLFNFQLVDLPIQKLSPWLGSIQEIKESLTWYPEQGFSPNYLDRLNPIRGVFSASDNLWVDSSRKFELFRYEDPQIQGMRVYKLGKNIGAGISKYSFIQDSRWGIWMAMGAFAEFVKSPPYSIHDASPWPLPYDQITGCLWLPARMEPPFVIERTLALCAGSGPIVMQVTSEMDDESILLFDRNKKVIGKVSRVYSDMANGKWLCYRWVPEVVARNISSLLGGELREMRCNTISVFVKLVVAITTLCTLNFDKFSFRV